MLNEFLISLIPIPFLIYACYSDWKTRTVKDSIWVELYIIGFIILIFRIFTYSVELMIQIGQTIIFSMVITFIMLATDIWDGADAKGYFVILFVAPVQETGMFDPSVTLFINSMIFIVIIPFFYFGYNIYQKRKISFSIEKNIERVFCQVIVDFPIEVDSPFYIIKKNTKKGTWLELWIPFMIPLTLGYLIMIFYGLIFNLVI